MRVCEGITYEVTNKYKKSVEEYQMMYSETPEKGITIITHWRSGKWFVTPMDQDEVEYLQGCFDDEDDLEVTAFQNCDLDYTDDGVSMDYRWFGEWTEEEQDKLVEDFEDDGFFGLEEIGFTEGSYECYIVGGINIEEQ